MEKILKCQRNDEAEGSTGAEAARHPQAAVSMQQPYHICEVSVFSRELNSTDCKLAVFCLYGAQCKSSVDEHICHFEAKSSSCSN